VTTDHQSMSSFYISLEKDEVIYAPDINCQNSWNLNRDSISINFNRYSTYTGKLLCSNSKHPLVLCGRASNRVGNSWTWTAIKVDKTTLDSMAEELKKSYFLDNIL